MNNKIRKKSKSPKEKVPYSMPFFGNTSSAFIPLTLVTTCSLKGRESKIATCGFGIDLSWETGCFELDGNAVISDLVEIQIIMSYDPYSLEGKTVLTTGTPSGIGRAMAVECSKLGAGVMITGRDEKRLSDTFSLLRGDSHIQLVANLGKEEDLLLLVNRLPVSDGIAYIAGTVKTIPVTFLERQDMQHLFDVNSLAPTLLIAGLLEQKKTRKPSSIVFILPIEGPLMVHPGNPMYSVSKSAVQGMIRGLSMELASKKTRTSAVLPGMIDTPITYGSKFTEEQSLNTRNQYPLKHAASPEKIA